MVMAAACLFGCSAGTHSGSLNYQSGSGQVLNYDYKNVITKGHSDTPQKLAPEDVPEKGIKKGDPNFGKKQKT